MAKHTNISFEKILPWGTTGGDTGLSARLKLDRNFDKIKAWIDAIEEGLSEEEIIELIRRLRPVEYVEYRTWNPDTYYYNEEVNEDTGMLETSRVWLWGLMWECRKSGTFEMPGWGCTDWECVTAGAELKLVCQRAGNGTGLGDSGYLLTNDHRRRAATTRAKAPTITLRVIRVTLRVMTITLRVMSVNVTPAVFSLFHLFTFSPFHRHVHHPHL